MQAVPGFSSWVLLGFSSLKTPWGLAAAGNLSIAVPLAAQESLIYTALNKCSQYDTHAPLVVAVHRHVTIPLARLRIRECGTDASVEHATQPHSR